MRFCQHNQTRRYKEFSCQVFGVSQLILKTDYAKAENTKHQTITSQKSTSSKFLEIILTC